MTPFSLSLAAEKAIESAKLRLDQMDSRLLRARTSIAMAKTISHRVSADQLSSRKMTKQVGEITPPMSPVDSRLELGPNSSNTEEEVLLRNGEMIKLRDDLRRLRSRMSQSRAISDTLNLTPPRSRRPRPCNLNLSDKPLPVAAPEPLSAKEVIDQFPLPPMPRKDESADRRLSVPLAGEPPEYWPVVESFGMFVNRDGTSNFGSPVKDTFGSHDLPILTSTAEIPFSPRPYSSQSLLTPPAPSAPSPPAVSPFYNTRSVPFPISAKVSFPGSVKKRSSVTSLSSASRPSLKALGSSLTRLSFVTANESLSDLNMRQPTPERLSASSFEYSDPDTSITSTTTPTEKSPTKFNCVSRHDNSRPAVSRAQSSKDWVRPQSSISNVSFATLGGVASMGANEQEQLLHRCQSALRRISLSSASAEEQNRRSQRLQAVLAILEESGETLTDAS